MSKANMIPRQIPRAAFAIRCSLATLLVLAGLLAANAAWADDRDLIGRWKLTGDARDSSVNGLHATNHGVQFLTKRPGDGTPAATFDGKSSHLKVRSAPGLKLATGDFTAALWLHTEEALDDDLGDLVTLYDVKKRIGFNLSLRNNTGVTTCQANTRQLQFGIDSASEPKWVD